MVEEMEGPALLTTQRLHVEWAMKKQAIKRYLIAHAAVASRLQAAIVGSFHHNKHLINRFTMDGGGTPEMLLFFSDAAKQNVVGAIALYGADIRTMVVLLESRRRGYGREMIQFVIAYAKQQAKSQLRLSCQPKHSGEEAPEFFYEKCGFSRAKTQDAGALDLKCLRRAQERHVKMQMEIEPGATPRKVHRRNKTVKRKREAIGTYPFKCSTRAHPLVDLCPSCVCEPWYTT